VTWNTGEPLLAVHARKPHKTLRAQWARMTVEPVMTGMTTHATRAGRAGRATDGDLLFDMLVKLVYAGDITIETVYFVCKIVELFNDSFIVILRRGTEPQNPNQISRTPPQELQPRPSLL